MAKDAVVEFLPVIVDLMEQHSKCLYCPLCLVQHPLSLNLVSCSLLSINSIGAPRPLLQVEPFNLLPPVLNHDAMPSNPEFDRIDEVDESSLAKQDDIFRWPTGMVNVVDVGFLGSDEDVTARKAQQPITATTFGEVKGHRPLSVGPGLGRDSEAEGRSDGTDDIDKWVQATDGSEKPRTDLARVEGLAEFDVDISDLVVLEKS